MRARTIAIVGAGYSGTLLALQLLDRLPEGGRIRLIGRDAEFGRGLAYAAGHDGWLLNVPAARMSAFADRPDDFIDWLRGPSCPRPRADGTEWQPGDFAPRSLYGDYLRDRLDRVLAEPANAARLETIQAEVRDIEPAGDGFRLQLDRGMTVEADRVVLAIGNFGPVPPALDDPWLYESRFFRSNPWALDLFDGLDAEAPVLMLGTGLTMVDAVTALLDRGHRGPIHALSRRGLHPRRHGGTPDAPYTLDDVPARMRALARFIHREAMTRAAAGKGWQATIDALRPISQPLWQGWSLEERSRFLRHLRPWWDVHRHRIAPVVADRLDAAVASGQLRWHAGRLLRFEKERENERSGSDQFESDRFGGAQVEAVYRRRGGGELARIPAALVVNATGPLRDVDRIADPLIEALRKRGWLRPDPMRLGIDVGEGGSVCRRDGEPSGLFALGPPTIGRLWENVAVPDIRNQIRDLAARLLP